MYGEGLGPCCSSYNSSPAIFVGKRGKRLPLCLSVCGMARHTGTAVAPQKRVANTTCKGLALNVGLVVVCAALRVPCGALVPGPCGALGLEPVVAYRRPVGAPQQRSGPH